MTFLFCGTASTTVTIQMRKLATGIENIQMDVRFRFDVMEERFQST